jgi:hypothetical protein
MLTFLVFKHQLLTLFRQLFGKPLQSHDVLCQLVDFSISGRWLNTKLYKINLWAEILCVFSLLWSISCLPMRREWLNALHVGILWLHVTLFVYPATRSVYCVLYDVWFVLV